MAYQTGTANSPGHLLAILFDFAAANGWTVDEDIVNDAQTPPQGAIHRNNIYVSFYFFSDMLKIYPARGYSGGNPGTHTESAYADVLTSQSTGIRVNAITGPYSAYHFFESDTYIHVVIVKTNGEHRHFGFGESIEFGDWKHGEYFYGHFWNQASHLVDQPTSTAHSIPFGSSFNGGAGPAQTPTMYMKKNDDSALPGAVTATTFWYHMQNTEVGSTVFDASARRIGSGRILTGINSGVSLPIIAMGASAYNGFVPMIPIMFANVDFAPSPDNTYLLGTYPDVRVVNVEGLSGNVEHTVGSDTWLIFPLARHLPAVDGEPWSANMGLAYKKVTT